MFHGIAICFPAWKLSIVGNISRPIANPRSVVVPGPHHSALV
jgi:hypothetical protein